MQVQLFLKERGVPFEVIQHPATYDALRMAHSTHTPGREVAKTVLLRADGGFTYIVAVLPATRTIDLRKVSQCLGGAEVHLATEHEIAEHCPDCEFGALPPFGSQYAMQTLVDESLTEDEAIVFEGNTHREAIRMRLDEFRRLEEPMIAAFSLERAGAGAARGDGPHQ